jgi:DNA-directed RNA polymerase specialized sigma24 family protein
VFSPETKAAIERAGLTPAQADVIRLKYERGFGQRAIALNLGISRDSVRDRLRAAEAKIAREMGE